MILHWGLSTGPSVYKLLLLPPLILLLLLLLLLTLSLLTISTPAQNRLIRMNRLYNTPGGATASEFWRRQACLPARANAHAHMRARARTAELACACARARSHARASGPRGPGGHRGRLALRAMRTVAHTGHFGRALRAMAAFDGGKLRRKKRARHRRAHPDLNQGPADLQSAALTTELCTQVPPLNQ